MRSNFFTSSTIPIKKISGIQFGILSTEEKIKLSGGREASIANSGHEHGEFAKGTLYDPRTGPIKGIPCESCKNRTAEDPGHFSIIKFPLPLYNPLYVNEYIINILKCMCFKCGGMLVPTTLYEMILSYPRNKRLKLSKKEAEKPKNKTCKQCGFVNNISYSVHLTYGINFRTGKGENTRLVPEFVLDKFKKMKNIDIELVGCDPVYARPSSMILENILVIPPPMRPVVFSSDNTTKGTQDNLYRIYTAIIKDIKSVKKNTLSINTPSKPKRGKGKTMDKKTILEISIDSLNVSVCALMTKKACNKGEHSLSTSGGHKILNSIPAMMSGKTGLIRNNAIGKRVNYVGRSVISGDSQIDLDEYGLPIEVCMILFKKVIINRYNINEAKAWIKNGPKKWPGAGRILKARTGYTVVIPVNVDKRFPDKIKVIIDNLEYGDRIFRHLMDGDHIIANRQPSLHKLSLMTHRVKVFKNNHTFRLNVCSTPPYNADFDGDEMNIHVLHESGSIAEAIHIMGVVNHIINPIDAGAIISPIQDNIIGGYLITKNADKFLDRVVFMDIIGRSKYININLLEPNVTEFKTILLLELILPPKFTIIMGGIKIINSRFVSGVATKKAIKKIIKKMNNNFGSRITMAFISSYQKITDRYLAYYGITISINDCYIDPVIKKKLNANFERARKKNSELVNAFGNGMITIPITQTPKSTLEGMVKNDIIAVLSTENEKILIPHLERKGTNNFIDMYKSGSKGEEINVMQILCSVGQQTIDGERVKMSYGNRTLPHYSKYDNSLEARGFVKSAYADGLTGEESFYTAKGGRMGVIDTALKTSISGTESRHLVKAMESEQASNDNFVRHSNKEITSFSFGGDHFNPVRLERNEIIIKKMNLKQFADEYI